MGKQKKGLSFLNCEIVLDLTGEKGMFCARLLADTGARVTRIEKASENTERSTFFAANNLGKRSVTLNLQSQKGRGIFKRLAESADVIIESFQPGYLKTLGLDYATLLKLNPGLIMASITSYGQDGPYRDYNSDDSISSAMGGSMYINGESGLPPLKPFGKQAYYIAGLFAANGILLALLQRDNSGKGQYIDISIQECVAATLDHVLPRYFYEGVVAKRNGSLYWNNAFRIFKCKDGYILLTISHQWETLVELLAGEGAAEDLTDEKYQNTEIRNKNIAHIIEVLERWTVTHKVDELVEKGQAMHFPWAKVNSIPGLLASPQFAERGFWTEIEYRGSKYRFPGAPFAPGIRAPAPGENNFEIYHRRLGLSGRDIESMAKEGVI